MQVTIIQQNQLRRDWLNVVRPFRVVREDITRTGLLPLHFIQGRNDKRELHEAKTSHYNLANQT